MKWVIDIEIDELTNSIKNTISGDSFPTEIMRLSKSDLKISVKQRAGNLTGNLS